MPKDYYQKFLNYKENLENIEEVEDNWKNSWNKRSDELTEDELEKGLLEGFIEKNKSDGWDIEDCILVDFPLETQITILQNFVNDEYYYAFSGAEYEIGKLIYLQWEKFITTESANPNHKKMRAVFESIIQKLEILYTCGDSMDKFHNLIRENNLKTYPYWNLLGFYSLLGEKGIDMIKKVSTLRYDDAQDMLMFGIYQFDPNSFLEHLRWILKYWDENENIEFESGTGMMYELCEIVNKYDIYGIKLFEDKIIGPILKKHELMRFMN